MSRSKFMTGDIVVANEKARGVYWITRPGWKGTVAKIWGNKLIRVREQDFVAEYNVDPECFDLVERPFYDWIKNCQKEITLSKEDKNEFLHLIG